ncbi:MAG: class D beta-lactamase [Nitrospirae bacterium]|nr:class D beta-lactamase [Magnetococcales bacterium]
MPISNAIALMVYTKLVIRMEKFMRERVFGLIGMILFTASVGWTAPVFDARLAHVLHQAGVEGCIAVVQISQNRTLVSDISRCQERLMPASTFKIVQAVIALETGVVREDEIFFWDKTAYSFKAWEQDMTLRQAMAVSAVPVFQQIARRIGLERMAQWLVTLNYGNTEIGGVVDRFWLDGPLSISPLEQAKFMAQLAMGQLPVSPSSMMVLRRVMPQEAVEGWHLFGKTGWAVAASPKVGWYVGWGERQGERLSFALTIPMPSLEQAPLRISLAKEALRTLGILATQEPVAKAGDGIPGMLHETWGK